MHSTISHGDVQSVVALEDGRIVTGTVQDCDPTREDATARRNAGLTGTREMKHAARFPPVLIEKYCNDAGIQFSEWMGNPVHIQRMLADPALKDFRIWEGRVA